MARKRNLLQFLCITGVVSLLLLSGCGKSEESAPAPQETDSSGAHVIKITGNDQMRYNVTEFEVSAGEEVKVMLTNVGMLPKAGMAHNFVLLKLGTDATDFAMAGASAMDNDYIAPSEADKVIAHTALAGSKETVEVVFTAPSEPGSYDYICTFPGHFLAGMSGVMIVK